MFKSLSRDVMIYGGANVIKSLVPFIMLPILTAYLTVEEVGTLSLIETNILILTPFVLLNISSGISVEYFRLDRSDFKEYVTNALLLTVASFVFFSILFYLFKTTFSDFFSITETIVSLIAVFTFVRVINNVALAIFQMSSRPWPYAFYSGLQTFFDVFFSIILVVYFKCNYLGRLSGVSIAFLLTGILGFLILIRGNYIGKLNLKYTKDILSYGIPLIPHVLGGTIMAMSDRYFISYFFNNESVGLYSIAYQLSAIMLLVSMSVNQAWTPLLFRLLKSMELNKIIIITSLLSLFFTMVFFIALLLEDFLFNTFVSEVFNEAKRFYLYLLIGFLFQGYYFLLTNVLFYLKRTKSLSFITFIGASVNVILNYILIKIYGVIGVAYATSITWVLYFLLVVIYLKVMVGFSDLEKV